MRRTMPASILRNSECCDGRCQYQEAENCVFHTYPLYGVAAPGAGDLSARSVGSAADCRFL